MTDLRTIAIPGNRRERRRTYKAISRNYYSVLLVPREVLARRLTHCADLRTEWRVSSPRYHRDLRHEHWLDLYECRQYRRTGLPKCGWCAGAGHYLISGSRDVPCYQCKGSGRQAHAHPQPVALP